MSISGNVFHVSGGNGCRLQLIGQLVALYKYMGAGVG